MVRLLTCILLFWSLASKGQEKQPIVPDFATLQFAGSIGVGSVGFGYEVFGNNVRFSLHYGRVPVRRGGNIHVFAAKMAYVPLIITASSRAVIHPLDIGLMASWHEGDGIKSRWPEYQYPRGYYWWHPSLRFHLLTETSIRYDLPGEQVVKSVTGYVELNANDLYIISFAQNAGSVRLTDIVKTGIGIRIGF